MRKQTSSLDGFVPRRRPNNMGEIASAGEARETISARPELSGDEEPIDMKRRDIDQSLSGIDDEDEPKKRRGLFRRRRGKKVLTRKQKIIRRSIKALAIILILIVAFVAIKTFIATNNVLQGNIFDILQNKPLKMDPNGRTNILLFGTSEDDPGHEAGSLTDSIMVVSLDQKQKNAYMVSIPRDLYVDYDGTACTAGFRGKINVIYGCHSNDGKKEKAGARALQKKVGEVLGLDMHYYAHVNYTVVRDVVKALGGITVKIESRDPRGVMDSNFDWKCKGGDLYASYSTMVKNCPPNGHFIDYPNGKVKLDAEHALYLAQARGDKAPTYGLEQSNFDREKNQQKIVKAIREKAVSAGTITNVGKVTGLIDALGNNLRTDFQVSEVRTLMQLGENIPSDSIKSISLVQEGEELVTTATIGASVVVPAAGTYDYSQIHAYIAMKLSKDPVVREAASIYVLNGTDTAGLAQTEAAKLTTANYSIASSDNAPSNYKKTTVYRLNKKSDVDGTAKALAKRYGVTLITSALPFAINGNPDFVIIVGASAVPKETN